MSMKLICSMALLSSSAATKLADMEHGAKFEKCIKLADWEGKGLDDDITLEERDANGCCPAGTVPGAKHYNNYVGAQVVCGFKEDGTVATSTSTSNGVSTCTYNSCYVWKQNLKCTDGNQFLNGCCAAEASCANNACGFEADCKNYEYTFKDLGKTSTNYCLTYDKNYKMENTADKADDQSDGKLQTDKVYVYTPCSGGSGGGGDSTGDGKSSRSSKALLGVASLLAMLAGFTNA